jgi:hypothetical protein
MKRLGDFQRPANHQIAGDQAIDRSREILAGNFPLGEEVGDLPQSVNARIGAARTGQANRVLKHPLQRGFQRTADRNRVGLHLPAMIGSALVLDVEPDISRCHRTCPHVRFQAILMSSTENINPVADSGPKSTSGKGLFRLPGMEAIFFAAICVMCLLMPRAKGYDDALLVMGALWLTWRYRARRPWPRLDSLTLPLTAFFGWLILSTLTAVDPQGASEGLLQWVAHLLAFLVFLDIINTPRRLALVALAFTLANAYLGIMALQEYFSGVYRIGGPSGAWPTVLGCYLVFALPWTLCILYTVKSPNLRFLVGLVALLLVFALGGTLTRSALAGFLVSLAVLSIHLLRRKMWRFQTLVVLVLILLLLFPAFLTRLTQIAPETLGDIGFSRPVFWEQSLSLMNEGLRILTGVGMKGSFRLVFRELPVALVDGQFAHLDHAHNFLIQGLVAWGLPGLLAYLWFLGSYVKQLIDSFRRNPSLIGKWIQWGALATLAGFWTAELFDIAEVYRTNMACYWWTLAAGLAAGRLEWAEQTAPGEQS